MNERNFFSSLYLSSKHLMDKIKYSRWIEAKKKYTGTTEKSIDRQTAESEKINSIHADFSQVLTTVVVVRLRHCYYDNFALFTFVLCAWWCFHSIACDFFWFGKSERWGWQGSDEEKSSSHTRKSSHRRHSKHLNARSLIPLKVTFFAKFYYIKATK